MRIEGRRIALRDFRRDDIEALHGWVNEPGTRSLITGGSFPQTLKETELYVASQMETDPLNRGFVIEAHGAAIPIGTCGFRNIDWKHRNAELGILIGSEELRGRGLGAEATTLLLHFGFVELNLHRVYLRTFGFNERAMACFKKCGFKREGCLQEAFFRDGSFHNIFIMAMLEEEFGFGPSSL